MFTVSLLWQTVLLSAKHFVGFMYILEFTVGLEIALWTVIDSSSNVEIFLFFALFFEFLVFVRFFVNRVELNYLTLPITRIDIFIDFIIKRIF